MDTNRLENVYASLVDETENPATYRNREKSELLRKLLDLCEYLRGDTDDEPLDDWFGEDE